MNRIPMMKIAGTATLALAMAATVGCASTGANGYGSNDGYYGSAPSGTACYDCGTVTRIEAGAGSRAPNATGAVVGGLVGAVAARELAKNQTDSTGKQNTATVAGAAAGALIGNAIQNRNGTGYNIYVRMQDGRETVVMQDDLGSIRVGSYVRIANGHAYLR
jgi:outer membrane lipoprotein SlyB